MKKLLLIAMVLLTTIGLTMAQEKAHRYEIKSGIAHEVTRLNEHETPADFEMTDFQENAKVPAEVFNIPD